MIWHCIEKNDNPNSYHNNFTEIQTTVNNNTVNVVISFSVNDIPSPVDIGISVNETSGITVETGNLTNFEGTGIS